jgi:hypothetical protein
VRLQEPQDLLPPLGGEAFHRFQKGGVILGLHPRHILPRLSVPLADTVKGFGAIVSGEMDEYPEQAFFNVGTLDDVIAKAKTL